MMSKCFRRLELPGAGRKQRRLLLVWGEGKLYVSQGVSVCGTLVRV